MAYRRLTYRSRVTAQEYLETIGAINATNKVKQSFTGGAAAFPRKAAWLMYEPNFLTTDVICVGNGVGWKIIRGSLPEFRSLTGGKISYLHSEACKQRWESADWMAIYGTYAPYHGYRDATGIPDDYFLYGGEPVTFSHYYGDCCFNAAGARCYHDDPTASQYPGFYNVSDPWTSGVPEALFPGASNQYPPNTPDLGGYCEGAPWIGLDAPGSVYSYPGCGAFVQSPIGWSSWDPGNTNHVGMVPDLYVSPWTAINVAAQPLGYPQLLKRLPDGSVIHSAMAEVTVDAPVRSIYHYEQSDPHTSGTWTMTSSSEDIGVILVGRRQDGGIVEQDVLGSAMGGDLVSGKTCVVDVGGLVVEMYALRNSEFDSFGLALSPSTEVFGATNLSGMCDGLMPTIEYAYYEDPDWEEDYMGGGDFVWTPTQHGEHVTWGAVTIGDVVIEFSLPSGLHGRMFYPSGMPDMATIVWGD